VQWFYTSGHNTPSGPPQVPQPRQGYFAMLMKPMQGPHGHLYKPLYSLVGAGAARAASGVRTAHLPGVRSCGATRALVIHAASNYKQVATPDVCKVEAKLLLYNCTVCHYTEPGATTLYEPRLPGKPCKLPPISVAAKLHGSRLHVLDFALFTYQLPLLGNIVSVRCMSCSCRSRQSSCVGERRNLPTRP
jgi:hypothetical protein